MFSMSEKWTCVSPNLNPDIASHVIFQFSHKLFHYHPFIDCFPNNIEVISSQNTECVHNEWWLWSFHSCWWWDGRRPSFMWSLWVICNKQMIFKPRRSLQGRPVIGCNPVLLSSPDGRKWQRRVSEDNGYTAMCVRAFLFLSLLHTYKHTYIQMPRCPWSMIDYCGRLSILLLPAQSQILPSYPCFRSTEAWIYSGYMK